MKVFRLENKDIIRSLQQKFPLMANDATSVFTASRLSRDSWQGTSIK